MKPEMLLGIDSLILGGRTAVLAVDENLAVDPEEVLEVRATWLRIPILHVVDALSGDSLSPVEIVKCSNWRRDDNDHPGDFEPSAVVWSSASSPVTLTPHDCGTSSFTHHVDLWVHSPGYAWARIKIDFEVDEERTLALQPAAELAITLVNYEPPPKRKRRGVPALNPMLHLRGDLDPECRSIAEFEAVVRTLERQYPTGKEATIKEFQTLIDRLRENPQLEGEIGLEHRLGKVENPIVLTGLEAGEVTATVDLGDDWDDDRIILGWVSARLEAGQRTEVDLVVEPLPRFDPPVPLAGTFFLPPAWGEVKVSLTLQAMDLPGVEDYSIASLSLSEMEPVAGREGLYRWSAGKVIPGRYEAIIDPFNLQLLVRVPTEGSPDAHIEIGEPASVVVRVLEAESGTRASIKAVCWNCEQPDEIDGGAFDVAEYDEEIGGFPFVAPEGRVEISCWQGSTYVPHHQVHQVRAGDNEITVYLEKACGLILRVREGGERVSFEVIRNHFHLEGSDGELAVLDSGDRIDLPEPGSYRIRIDPIEGYEPVEPVTVEVPPGEFVRHVVELKKAR